MAATTALREALNRGTSSGCFIDTKIILYSYRDSSGLICRPKALYSNSHILKTVPYFNDLLFGDFAESQSKDFRDPIDEEELVEDYGYSSVSDLENDEDGIVSTPDPPVVPCDGKIGCEGREERTEKGKVVKIPDVAFVTFQAFLMYLYTGVIEFAPFGSGEHRRTRSVEIIDRSDDKVPRPSPKSIYRLADKYDVPALKDFALYHIRVESANCDIVGESFSRFASQYDEIRSLYIGRLAYALAKDSTSEKTRTSLEEKIYKYAEGGLEDAMETLSALWEIASGDVCIEISNASSVASWSESVQPTNPSNWALVNRALIKSIRNGVFLDRMYWARYCKAGGGLKPIYFSSTVMSDTAQQLNNCFL